MKQDGAQQILRNDPFEIDVSAENYPKEEDLWIGLAISKDAKKSLLEFKSNGHTLSS